MPLCLCRNLYHCLKEHGESVDENEDEDEDDRQKLAGALPQTFFSAIC